jgi:S1-C subfamily serine protease
MSSSQLSPTSRRFRRFLRSLQHPSSSPLSGSTMIRSIVLAVLLVATGALAQNGRAPEIRKSLVRITTTSQDPDYKAPWNPGHVSGGVGAGFVIAGQRILTNAHVVSNSRFITIEKEDDPRRYVATVQFVGHDCDLAILKVGDQNFFKNTGPLDLGGLPEIESSVEVFGYPIGGERMSVTQGIVSRLDFQVYTHSGVDTHLAVQISAAINPGNSGGPVLQSGKVIGVAFQGYSGDVAQNVGYMIPTPVIQRFLRDISDGHYKRYVDLSISYFKLVNSAERRALGLEDDDRGVMVSTVSSEGSCSGKLKEGDVLLSVDGHPIASDGFVQLDGARLDMAEVVERKFKDDKVTFGILRNKENRDVEVTLEPNIPYLMQAQKYDEYPRFVLFAGLLFQPLSRNFMEAYQADDLRLRYFYDFFITDELYVEHPEIVVLSNILPDPVNAYLSDFRYQIVDQVNDQKIRTLNDVAAALAKPAPYYIIKFVGGSRPAVLENGAVQEARERILAGYNVRIEQNVGTQTMP